MKGTAIVTILRTEYKCSDGCCYEEWYDVTISINEEDIMTERYNWDYNEDYVVDALEALGYDVSVEHLTEDY
ncbi:hypothetical protein [Abyssicoccus albus]|uniref:Uncharacterized protein n=1 Tax=Abyssicoccus albus TaxID=1817405 RepID=A0A3N5BB62_9BACL|nr:hypothetical protein [Abyssicoccus albus]RPF54754.1 hypothetical protein EDD62_1714 [Abyssicoccus albus]